jgi:hypothetical protein
MLFHLPSFVIGYVAGFATAGAAPRLRPLAVELATAAYKLADALAARAARGREDVQDLLAEARARARGACATVRPS